MNILIVANHWAVCSGRYAAEAFARLGHTVKHVGPAMGRRIWGLELPERYVWEPDDQGRLLGAGVADQFDLIVVMDSDPAILDMVKAWHHRRTVVWGVDNHVRDYRRPWFAHYFLAHRNVSMMPWERDVDAATEPPWGMHREGVVSVLRDDMTHLPCAYDPKVFTPSPIPWAERTYDVAMIGVMYPQRWEAVEQMRKAGLKVLAGTGLVYENMAATYQNARIGLCLSAAGDVGQRIFESAACGCVVLTDDCPDFVSLEPEGCVVFDGLNEMWRMAVNLVQPGNPAGAMLASRAVQWATPHTWDARAQVIVDWLERQGEA